MSNPPEDISAGEAPRVMRQLMRKPLTPRRAARWIAGFTVAITVMGGVLIWLLDRTEYSNLGVALWFALQTVTTVGYGDVAPADSVGRAIGSVLMIGGVAMVSVVTAAVTAALIHGTRQRLGESRSDTEAHEISRRLDAIEQSLRRIESRR